MDQQQQQMNQMLKQTAQVLTSLEDRITNLEKKDDRVVLFEVRERLQKIEEKEKNGVDDSRTRKRMQRLQPSLPTTVPEQDRHYHQQTVASGAALPS